MSVLTVGQGRASADERGWDADHDWDLVRRVFSGLSDAEGLVGAAVRLLADSRMPGCSCRDEAFAAVRTLHALALKVSDHLVALEEDEAGHR